MHERLLIIFVNVKTLTKIREVGLLADNYLEEYGKETGQDVAERTLNYFSELFSMEMPLHRMVKMMPGMVKFMMAGKGERQDLINFMPQMMPMMKQAIIGKKEE